MNKNIKYFILITSLFICVISLFSTTSEKVESDLSLPNQDMVYPEDTGTLYPVKKTQISNYEDLTRKSPIDLRDPSNIKTNVEFDTKHNVYLFRTKIDNDEWVTPFTLNPKQYLDYSLKESMSRYFKQKNDETFAKKDDKEAFSLKDIKVNMGALERIFGPGGVQVKTQGYVELSMGLKNTSTDNPTLAQKNRNRTMFDFDEKIQVNVDASVGDKVNFGLNYDTEATFDFDSKKAKLAYEGKEDEIIRYLEAGNISMNTTNSLITGATSLFGVRADLQFGKLKVNAVISQKETQTQTASSSGGVQTTPFEFKADEYDENQHFFLSQYFRDNFDNAMSKLPYVQSPVLITKIEVWVTNKQGNWDNARNIVAFADMGEYNKIGNSRWTKQGSSDIPYNGANNLYSVVNSSYSAARYKDQANAVLTGAGLQNGQDFEKLENARKLDASEYTFNEKLGYISLNSALSSDQVLAVAFEYSKGNDTYKVGEFASEIPSQEGSAEKSGSLFLKLLKPVALYPQSYSWDLMMKNVYKLGSIQIQKDKFRLNISYQSDSIGTYTNYIPEGNIKNQLLLRVMNLDRLNSSNNTNPDGIFDFLDGYTINAERGRIIFPVVEPFGEHLRKKIGNNAIADKYVYQELYDSTLTVAQQAADKNKFKISGSFRASASSGSVISLNAMNVAKGSVKVTANGTVLTENVDYTVDYIAGTVTIINQSLIDTGTSINVSLEDQSMYSMQRQTLLGLNLSYDFTKNFNVGATILHMYEKPLTYKSSVGDEALKNTVWGLNTSYRTQSQWLTNLIDKLPFVNATAPSEISLNAEFAQMIPGHYENQYSGGYSYLDDFEAAKTSISLVNAYGWKLSSTPTLFEEAKLTNDIEYGNNRARFAWFNIDNLFTRNTSRTPSHITKEDLDNPFVREIGIKEIYPGKDIVSTESSTLTALNLSYYPTERGPYNLDDKNINSDGELLHPENRWGGITRKLDNTNFENSNIEYIEFWLLDPFVENPQNTVKNTGGYLYFDLGEISEDVLKDGKKFFENGLPTDASSTEYETTKWGRVPTRQSTAYAFDNTLSDEARARQDVGFNGLSTADELTFPTYATYLNNLRSKLSSSTINRWEQDAFSPFNDPGGDNYHYYRGSDYDEQKVSILNRYKYYNGTEGNTTTNSNESYSTAASSVPDVEDLNQDYTMNESENYYQYKVALDPNRMSVGSNYISEIREVTVNSSTGSTKNKWYQFKIPLNDFNNSQNGNKKYGNIQGFKTIRFMRMFVTGFKQETFLRFATLDLVRGEWRTYTQALEDGINQGDGSINVSAVNIEENGNKSPVNYVVPPGVKRIVDSNQSQLTEDNEQALALQVLKLEPFDARAIYKNTVYDLRRYKRLQMFTHAEELIDGPDISQGEMTVFLRLGSDYKNNYYEYEIPLTITPPGTYNSKNANDQLTVWPEENMFDFPLKLLTNLKLARNKEKRKAGSDVSYTKLYSITDPDKQQNKVSIIGNPSLSDVQVMMIGVRNNSRTTKSAEIWVNELRMTDFDEEGGWAAQGNLNVQLSDIGSVNLTGRKETIGFGSIDQSLNERRSDDYSSYTISTNLDLGRFIPEKIKASIPFYYSYSNQTTTPKYDPLNQDITLKESLDLVDTKAEKDSIKNLAQDKTTTKSLSFSNVKFDIKSKNPMPYDPANFTLGYAYSETEAKNPTTVYDVAKNYKASLNYSYSPAVKTWEPFKNIKSKSPVAQYPKSLGINLLPSNISFNSYITRYYTETLTRDLDSYTIGGDNSQNEFLSWSQNFYWDRDFSINWDLLRNLKISLQTGTRAEIEEPYLQVNKKLNRDDYEVWRDSVWNSIKNLGDPLSYKQTAKVTYTLPLSNIPFLNWINSSANYDSQYSWDRGAEVDSLDVGNVITNNITLSTNNRLEMTTLYNKSPFLRKVNDKFSSNNRRKPNNQRQERAKKERLKRFTQEVVLNPDSSTIVQHNLNSKRIDIIARRDGRIFKIKYKRIDDNSVRIMLKDTATIQLSIAQKEPTEETTLYKVAEYAARGLMSVRSVSINYSARNETAIAGFKPGIGDAFGQKRTEYGITPGLDFAFGFKGGEEYLDRALRNDWLVLDENNISPAVYNTTRKLELEAMLEPARGLKIRLSALREKTDRTSYQYYNYPDATVKTLGGSFTITTVSLASSFDSGNSKNGYHSKAFEKFRKNREIITRRWENKFNGITYPNSGFIAQAGMGGNTYYSKVGEAVNENSSDVLIPAFLAAYTGRNVRSISLNPFPTLSSLLPNWRITYDGLTSFPWFKDKFKNLILSHAYTSQYSVGSYQSFSSWIDAGNGLGFIKTLDDNPLPAPSSAYDISAVSLIEQFNPLFGAEGTMNNNLIIKARYNHTRALNLSISSFQIIENLQKDLIVGLGYRINEFNKIMGWNKKKQSGFNNDMVINADLSRRTTQSLIRKIEDGFTEATSGTTILSLKISADYSLSKALIMRAYFDRIINSPLISTSSYPTSNTNFGISLRFTLSE